MLLYQLLEQTSSWSVVGDADGSDGGWIALGGFVHRTFMLVHMRCFYYFHISILRGRQVTPQPTASRARAPVRPCIAIHSLHSQK